MLIYNIYLSTPSWENFMDFVTHRSLFNNSSYTQQSAPKLLAYPLVYQYSPNHKNSYIQGFSRHIYTILQLVWCARISSCRPGCMVLANPRESIPNNTEYKRISRIKCFQSRGVGGMEPFPFSLLLPFSSIQILSWWDGVPMEVWVLSSFVEPYAKLMSLQTSAKPTQKQPVSQPVSSQVHTDSKMQVIDS